MPQATPPELEPPLDPWVEPPPLAAVEVTAHAATAEDRRLYAFFDTLEQDSLKHLEDAARQIIGLVTALLTLAVGLLALGGEPVAPLLATWPVLAAGGVTLAALLLALIAALDVVLPAAYRYRAASLTDRRAAYDQMLARKANGLRAAVVFFGIAMLGLAALIVLLLWARVG
jgi:hypothetical protein